MSGGEGGTMICTGVDATAGAGADEAGAGVGAGVRTAAGLEVFLAGLDADNGICGISCVPL